MGIYAEKRRQKRWHDTHVKTGRFRKGDLVLLYTLKKNKRKLKMRGLGPFVINDLSPSGAVRLESLDGEPMANFINDSRLKKYNEPLTQEMLDRMHIAKTKKEQAEQLKLQAFKEAQERALRAKARRQQMRVMPIAMTEPHDAISVDPFYIAINLLTEQKELKTHAFIDSGADVNVLSWDTWNALGRPGLQPTKREFLSFSKTGTTCLGCIYLKTRIQDVPVYSIFYVANKDECLEHVIVGRLWMKETKCQLDWDDRRYTLHVNSQTLIGTSLDNPRQMAEVTGDNR